VEDFMAYQGDVHAVQADLFRPMLDAMNGLVGPAEDARRMLIAWDGETRVDRVEPFVLDRFLTALAGLAWDEEVFRRARAPNETTLIRLLENDPNATWFDVVDTPARETGRDILEAALADAAGALESTASGRAVVWGDEHRLVIRHITRSSALQALWRGPFPYPGFSHTLSPAGSMQTTHSASWRVVVDLSERPPLAFGVYPGGQSGNPFSIRYGDQIDTYLTFDYNRLLMPTTPDDLSPEETLGETRLSPSTAR
jgi:penicillin amidase